MLMCSVGRMLVQSMHEVPGPTPNTTSNWAGCSKSVTRALRKGRIRTAGWWPAWAT